jgi:tyrosine phenol-lyase
MAKKTQGCPAHSPNRGGAGNAPRWSTFCVKTIIEPFRIKSVEPIRMSTPEQREEILRRAHFNPFLIHAPDVIIDLLTDSGTGAMSSEQWAGVMRADESYAGAESFYRFERSLREITGFEHILPTHQGRASERILFELVGGEGKVVPSNGHFDTTRANIEHSGARAVDLTIPESRDPRSRHPFKGNMDIAALEGFIASVGVEKIPLVMMTVTNNSVGGQPVSLENLRAVRAICDRLRIPLFLDACRFAENAWFIRQREFGGGSAASGSGIRGAESPPSVRQIARAMFDLADGAIISAKKDGLVNIGGVLLVRDAALLEKAGNLLILTEGYVTYGGLAGRDLEAMAQGFQEVLEDDYLAYRIRSTAYLGEQLTRAGIQIVEPPGGHAVYIDAGHFCPHIPATQFPGQSVVCGLYRTGGIRSCEIGSVMFGAGDDTPAQGIRSVGEGRLELVRLAIPRRVYTQSHIDYVAEAAIKLFESRRELRGMRITQAPPVLRHFTAKFAEI